MKVLVGLVFLISVHCACSSNTTTVKSCHDALLPVVQLVTNNTVCEQGPCVVRPGTDLIMTVTFRAPKYLEKIQFKVVASALGVNLDYPLFQDDACDGIRNTYCPIVKDELVEYSYTMHLLDLFPEAAVGLTFTLVNKDDNSDVFCFGIDIQLKKG